MHPFHLFGSSSRQKEFKVIRNHQELLCTELLALFPTSFIILNYPPSQKKTFVFLISFLHFFLSELVVSYEISGVWGESRECTFPLNEPNQAIPLVDAPRVNLLHSDQTSHLCGHLGVLSCLQLAASLMCRVPFYSV